MKKLIVLRYGAIATASLGLVGMAAASTVSIGTTGPSSNNQATLNNTNSHTRVNTNALGVSNFNFQVAGSGDVNADHNTSVSGGLSSGMASNSASTSSSVVVNNSAGGAGMGAWPFGSDSVSMNLTGPNSNNQVTINNSNTSSVVNTNLIGVQNHNLQFASSGDVNADHNTTVGGLSSGAASNTSNTSTSISVSN